MPAEAFHFWVVDWSAIDQIIPVREHDMLQTACENFIRFTISVQVGDKDELV